MPIEWLAKCSKTSNVVLCPLLRFFFFFHFSFILTFRFWQNTTKSFSRGVTKREYLVFKCQSTSKSCLYNFHSKYLFVPCLLICRFFISSPIVSIFSSLLKHILKDALKRVVKLFKTFEPGESSNLSRLPIFDTKDHENQWANFFLKTILLGRSIFSYSNPKGVGQIWGDKIKVG